MSMKNLIAKIVVVAIIAVFCFWGCKKDGSSDKLTLTLKSVSADTVTQGRSLSIVVECSDVSKLSTKGDTAIGVKFILMNANKNCTIGGVGTYKLISYPVPDLTGSTSNSGNINFNFTGSGLSGIPGNICRPRDTTQVKIWVKSQAGIVSDTLVLPNYLVIKNGP